MSEARSFINPKAQNYATLKNGTPMNANQQAKFDVLNGHIVNTVVLAGELVIVGDPDTSSCTSHEAFLMGKAAGIHRDIMLNGGGVDGFMLDNFEMLQSLLAHASMGAGAASDGWARYLDAIKKTLEQIELLHREHMSGGVFRAREEFYAKRVELFRTLDEQLGRTAAYGSGLRNQGSIKRMLQLSTKRYLNAGEISGYAEKVTGVAKAASLIKKGAYIGVALDVAATGLEIKKACTLGREKECARAKYVEGGSLLLGLTGSSIVGAYGGAIATGACAFVLGITTGPGSLVCGVVGGAVGGAVGGEIFGGWGEIAGDFLYRKVSE
ncbi:hypothetical protein CXG50_10490 [Pseudomonas plecoglossicida]|jgi:hypothetical protein|uniref:SSU ribosomal protein S2p (SAe) n=2 Tax=Pseudomonas TaxID=286 RepID=A0A0P7CX45_PSEPU|nr:MULTISPECIES: hypothetical protein [Pseudomonas]TXI04826.1 MAG: hypothetical protein E6Q70_12235 [Pseudomonas monteilii]AGA71161.1 hypothetical protein B479_01215 [Pseudomonas putida HB3267]KPM60577.1 hypothetical protein HB13667_21450 [Pseudomonas putida]MCE0752999.1 hypothetical protein [Pseudomonas asiatica]MCE0942587.1 hypothetical protein [Pseudomonas asiatica]